MVTTQEIGNIIGTTAYDSEGRKIGKVGQVYFDDDTGRPEWITVKTGLFGMKESFVPLALARIRPDRDVEIEVDKDTVSQAPNIEPDQELSREEEIRLYEHYGLSYTEGSAYAEGASGAGTQAGRRPDRAEEAMTRSEEQVRVGKTQEATGRARLRKYVVTEPVEEKVQVRREEARIEREPITDANREEAMSGPDITESEHEVTLHAERPVVEKKVEPVERVRMTTDEVVEEETVSDEVRKERIEAEGDISGGSDRPTRRDRRDRPNRP